MNRPRAKPPAGNGFQALARTLATATIAALVLALAGGAARADVPPRRPAVTTPRIYVLDCGTITNDRPEHNGLTRDEVKYDNFADMCYLIVHPKGTLLWDTGIPDSYVGRPLYETMFLTYGFIKTNTLVGQLASIGYRPSDIDFLSLSHLHIDHSGNGNLFTKSTWLVARPEYDSAFSPKSGARVFGLENYDRLKDARKVFIQADHDVFGDGSVVIKRAFGHSPGHSVLAVKLARTGTVVLAGDLYHYPEERRLHRIGPLDAALGTAKARADIEAWVAANKAQLWIAHDMTLFSTLKRAPAYYE